MFHIIVILKTKQKLNQIGITIQQNLTLKNAAGVDTSQFAKKHDLGNLKSRIDNFDIDKL